VVEWDAHRRRVVVVRDWTDVMFEPGKIKSVYEGHNNLKWNSTGPAKS
jgi:hypothetical protein